MPTDLSSISDLELSILYHGLCELVSAPSGKTYFHNADRSHLFYIAGAKGKENAFKETGGDSPEENPLFRIGDRLLRECIHRSPNFLEIWLDRFPTAVFSSWENFCEAAIGAHKADADK